MAPAVAHGLNASAGGATLSQRTVATAIVAGLSLLLACACSPSGSAAPGSAPTETPSRVVSLSCAATDVVLALGEVERLVAVEEDCPCAGLEGKTTIRNQDHPGRLAALNVESVLAMRADAVIAKPDLSEALSGRGLRVVFTPPAATFESIPALVRSVGALLGAEARAAALLDRMESRRADLLRRTQGLRRVRVYYETTGAGWTVGRGAVMDAMIELAGGRSIGHDVLKPSATLTPEAVLAADPEVIVLGAFADPVEDVVARPGWSATSAVREGRVHHLVPERRAVTLASPRCVDECEALLLPWLHPEAAGGAAR